MLGGDMHSHERLLAINIFIIIIIIIIIIIAWPEPVILFGCLNPRDILPVVTAYAG